MPCFMTDRVFVFDDDLLLALGCWLMRYIFFLASTAQCWDINGHWIISLIAGSLMSEKATRYVKETIRTDAAQDVPRSMAYASIWPDLVQGDPAYAWASDLHFAYSDEATKCKSYVEARDCPNGRCVVTALADYAMRASDFSIPKDQRSEAFKFVLHFMGDIHQPLHLGFVKDVGATKLFLNDPQTTLHHVWDNLLFQYYLNDNADKNKHRIWNYYAVYEDLLISMFKNLKANRTFSQADLSSRQNILAKMEAIATDTSSRLTCNVAYRHTDGSRIAMYDDLDDAYFKSGVAEMFKQFKLAGVRLAHLIDEIADRYYTALSADCAAKKALLAAKKVAVPGVADATRGSIFRNLEVDSDCESDREDEGESLVGSLSEDEILKIEKTIMLPPSTKKEVVTKPKQKKAKQLNQMSDSEFDKILAEYYAADSGAGDDPAPPVLITKKVKSSKKTKLVKHIDV